MKGEGQQRFKEWLCSLPKWRNLNRSSSSRALKEKVEKYLRTKWAGGGCICSLGCHLALEELCLPHLGGDLQSREMQSPKGRQEGRSCRKVRTGAPQERHPRDLAVSVSADSLWLPHLGPCGVRGK